MTAYIILGAIGSSSGTENTLSNNITLVIAIIGAVLGIINTWRDYSKDRINVRVETRGSILADGYGNTQHRLCVEVVNLSFMPVTISQISFTLHGDKKNSFRFFPEFMDNKGKLPRTLEARNSFTAFVPYSAYTKEIIDTLNAPYIETACGKRFKGRGMPVHSAMKDAMINQSI